MALVELTPNQRVKIQQQFVDVVTTYLALNLGR